VTGSDHAHRFGVKIPRLRVTLEAYKLEKSNTGQKMYFGIIRIYIPVQTKIYTQKYIHYFSQKNAKFPIPYSRKP